MERKQSFSFERCCHTLRTRQHLQLRMPSGILGRSRDEDGFDKCRSAVAIWSAALWTTSLVACICCCHFLPSAESCLILLLIFSLAVVPAERTLHRLKATLIADRAGFVKFCRKCVDNSFDLPSLSSDLWQFFSPVPCQAFLLTALSAEQRNNARITTRP